MIVCVLVLAFESLLPADDQLTRDDRDRKVLVFEAWRLDANDDFIVGFRDIRRQESPLVAAQRCGQIAIFFAMGSAKTRQCGCAPVAQPIPALAQCVEDFFCASSLRATDF